MSAGIRPSAPLRGTGLRPVPARVPGSLLVTAAFPTRSESASELTAASGVSAARTARAGRSGFGAGSDASSSTASA